MLSKYCTLFIDQFPDDPRKNLYNAGSESPYTHNESRTVDKYIL